MAAGVAFMEPAVVPSMAVALYSTFRVVVAIAGVPTVARMVAATDGAAVTMAGAATVAPGGSGMACSLRHYPSRIPPTTGTACRTTTRTTTITSGTTRPAHMKRHSRLRLS